METTKLISLICALREINSRDPSLLILTINNELGFQRIAPPGSRGLAYIASRKHHNHQIKSTLIYDYY
jgi:hypothetical protein